MKRNAIRALFTILLIASVVMALNTEVSITVGVDGNYRSVRMPLYVKWTQFLARHYEYARLAKEITAGCNTDEEKALAILKWTRGNLGDISSGMRLHDDHILNIIIRGYAASEQFQEVFTTLCSYSGIPAFYEKVYGADGKHTYIVSLAAIRGRWCVFDAYRGAYARTKSGDIASVEDLAGDRSSISMAGLDQSRLKDLPHEEFYLAPNPVIKPMSSRAEKQMPLQRILFELRKALKMEKDDEELLEKDHI